ncbi:hypothetical protein GCM10023205_84370 [Yinghuangia aomiensis]|uniref:Uncharacterized protein n=1 Tax=Yinghuangia aomiensis TaxID=676205 RepID=A0ABP9IIR9_9ACTN
MYLLHAQLHDVIGCGLPNGATQLLLREALPQDGLEHVSVHAHPHGVLVLGLFLKASALAVAEAAAHRLCAKAVAAGGPLDGFVVIDIKAGLVPQAFDRWLC